MAEETKEITLLAVSKRESGVCIAGVDSQLRWIRPVKDRILAPADIEVETDKGVVPPKTMCAYRMRFTELRPKEHQTENILMKSGEKLKFVKELAEKERLQLLNSLAENHLLESATKHGDILRILSKEKRSLVVIGPFDDFRIIQQERQMRIELKLPNGELVNGGSLPCTDLKFMTLIKKIKGGLPDKRIDKQSSEINELQGRKFFFLIGLTGEPYKDTYWPMIVGLHAIPDYPGGIEFDVI